MKQIARLMRLNTMLPLPRDFYLAKYEVTQAQYEAVMTGNSDGTESHSRSLAK